MGYGALVGNPSRLRTQVNKLFVFNPGSEAGFAFPEGCNYTPPSVVQVMMRDLSPMLRVLGTGSDVVYHPSPSGDRLLRCGVSAIDWDKESSIPSNATAQTYRLQLWGPEASSLTSYRNKFAPLISSLQIPRYHPQLRQLIHRATAANLMQWLRERADYPDWLVARQVRSVDEVEQLASSIGPRAIAKQPYSSSGRGLIPLSYPLSDQDSKAIANALKRSGSLMVEPRLDKLSDWASEWLITEDQDVQLCGYSHFLTNDRGAYIGNELRPQSELQESLAQSVGKRRLKQTEELTRTFIRRTIAPYYQGALGIDQLLYRSADGIGYFPAVEINLRMTMGHFAIELCEKLLSPQSRGQFLLAPIQQLPTRIPPTFDADGRLSSGDLLLSANKPDASFAAILRAEG